MKKFSRENLIQFNSKVLKCHTKLNSNGPRLKKKTKQKTRKNNKKLNRNQIILSTIFDNQQLKKKNFQRKIFDSAQIMSCEDLRKFIC